MRQGIAFHEAGHGVVADVLGIESEGVSIHPDADSLGRHTSAPPAFEEDAMQPSDAVLRAHAVATFAGPIAQRRGAPETWHPDHGAGDNEALGDLILRLCRNELDFETLGPKLEGEAEQLVSEHWAAVEAVADALLKRRMLRSAELRSIIRDTTPTQRMR